MSCYLTEQLQCNIFALPNVKKTIDKVCVIGDIIRCQKFFLQHYNDSIQGVASPNANWTVCKPNYYELNQQKTIWSFVNNKNIIDDEDFLILQNFITWKSTNPISKAILDSGLFDFSSINPSNSNNLNNIYDFYLSELILHKFSDFKEGFYNIVCQVIIYLY